MIYKLRNGDRISSGSVENNIIEVRLTNNFVKTEVGFEKIPYDKVVYQIGDKLAFANGRIVIGNGVKYIKIWGQAMISNNSNATKLTLHIQKNTHQTVIEGITYSVSAYSQINSVPKIINVSRGDYLEMQVHGAAGDVFPANTNNFLIVEVIE